VKQRGGYGEGKTKTTSRLRQG